MSYKSEVSVYTYSDFRLQLDLKALGLLILIVFCHFVILFKVNISCCLVCHIMCVAHVPATF